MGIVRTALASKPVAALTSPHHVDHYLERIHPMATATSVRGTVVEVRRETGDSSTVVIRANGAWKGFRPGQHVQFGVEVDGTRKVRVFSVSSSAAARPGRIRSGRAGRTFSVSVKAHPDGYVSQFLHREITPGTTIFLSQAEGEFVLPGQVPDLVLMISGGSGITPVMSMVRTLREQQHTGRITFLHYARTREDEMFTSELDELAAAGAEIVRVYTRETVPGAELKGRFSIDHVKHLGVDPTDTLTFVCGPAGLIATVRDSYTDLGAADMLRQEYFKVPSVDLDAADATGTLEFDTASISAENSGATILEQAEAAGLTPAFGCRMGVCNTCAVKKLSGAVRHVVTQEVHANTDETIKVCVHVPVGDVTVAL